MSGHNGGPWGGGDHNDEGKKSDPHKNRPKNPTQGQQPPEIDELLNKGKEHLRVLMGGKSGHGGGGNSNGQTPDVPKSMWFVIGGIAAGVLWLMASFYTVKPEEKSVELMLGKSSQIGESGLNFAPWPIVTREILTVTTERTIDIGISRAGGDAGLMLTGDENIVDIDFEVVWNINNPEQYLFNLANPETTIAAVSESAMREIISQSELAPILNRDRGSIAGRLRDLIQSTLDSYQSGVNIVRVNFDKADPPLEVIAAFRAVQDAEQERDRLQNVADAYSNRVVAEARGEAARLLEGSEAYRAQVVNEATGEASRFLAVYNEYEKAPDVTRKRLYLETMERVLGNVDVVFLGEGQNGSQGVVPYLPLNDIGRKTQNINTTGGAN